MYIQKQTLMKQTLPINRYFVGIFTLLLFSVSFSFAQETISIVADRDNSLYESVGTISNGSGAELFIGRIDRNTNFLRRALVHFDLSEIPEGATIETATLNVFVSRSAPGSGSQISTLHLMTSDWGEGGSDAGVNGGKGTIAQENDATWIHQFSPNTNWTNAGGDFVLAQSANTSISGVGSYSYANATMAEEVQNWLDMPETNFGWIILGNEGERKTAKKLESREAANVDRRPTLVITYSVATNIEDVQAVNLRVFPNPSTDGKLNIEATGLSVGSIDMRVINLVGMQLIRQEVKVSAGRLEENIDLSNWGSGIYFIHFRTESGTRTQKIVVR